MKRTILAFLALATLPLPGRAQPAAGDDERVLILDTKGQALVAVDLRTGAIARRSPLEGAPSLLLRSGTGSRWVVIDAGPQKFTFCCGLQPKGPVTAALLDGESLARVGGAELGWGVPTREVAGMSLPLLAAFYVPSPDGKRATILTGGYRSKKPEENLPRELVTFELESGRVEGRTLIDRPVTSMWGTADGQTIVLFGEATKGDAPLPAEVLFVDVQRQAGVQRVRLTGTPSQSLMAPGARWLYLLDPGTPSNKKEKNVNGELAIVSIEQRRVAARIDAGSQPRALVWDESHQSVLVPADGPPVEKGEKRVGELRVFLGSERIGIVSLPEEPHLLRLRGTRAFVAGRQTLSVVDLDVLRPQASIALDNADDLSELVFSKDDQRAFGLYEGSSRLSVLDLAAPKLVASVTTGRGGVKFAKALGAMALSVAATTASYYQGQSVAMTQNRNWFTYNIYNFGVAAPQASVVVRPDRRFAYALNTQSNDVTIVDVATGTVVSKEAAKGRTLAAFPNGARFAVLGKDELRLFDTQTQRPGEPLPFEDAESVDLLFSPGNETALAYGGKTLYLLDASSGEVRAQVQGLLSVGGLMFAGGGPRGAERR